MEKITNEIAEKVRGWLNSDEVKAAIEATEKAVESDTGTFEVVITTENIDRYQEVIQMGGWELEHYRANPVVLWGHDHFTLPIGVATDIRVENGQMIAKGKFAPHEFAQEIRALYDAGIVRATSVGFIEKEREGNVITKAELLEFSFVSVPANPYALSLAMEKELNINELVTKGIMTLKDISETEKDKEEDTAPEKTEEEPEPVEPTEESPEPELTDEQKALADFTARAVVRMLKDSGALEALETDEPERTEVATEETEDERRMREFNEARRSLQIVSTHISEVLADARKVIESSHS